MQEGGAVPPGQLGLLGQPGAQLEGQALLAPAPFPLVGQPGERLEQADERVASDGNGDAISPSWLTLESIMSLLTHLSSIPQF